ncbi:PEP-utilizing enzyme [Natrinema halophilum]|uniref:PEP-utilising enzyme mobile domain-containing protein n=1 Tax=Natrinema halophilum TaxID=1699371 RepID=A0A7D5H584_9EURY|nr:PEP-utilizing enzyme [Natrinema halophilum]QLG47855.1 hypothetical protein HYG82_02850 [Natrinema halophilum]
MNESPTQALLLASGRGVRRLDAQKSKPIPLVETPQGQAIIDSQIEAVKQADIDEINCLAGYHVEKLVETHPEIEYYYDSEWENDSNISGLAQYQQLLEGDLIVVTGETLLQPEAITRLRNVDCDVTVAVSRFPTNEAAQEAKRMLTEDELVLLEDGTVQPDVPDDQPPDARLLGAASVSDRGTERFRSAVMELSRADNEAAPSFYDVVATLSSADVCALEVEETVQTYDRQNALGRFLLGTKADTLARLDGILEEANILDQVVFDVATWEQTPEGVVDRIQSSFSSDPIVVRSSAVVEDGWHDSQAGAFHTALDVDLTDKRALTDSIKRVVESLQDGSGRADEDQVLIQPQVSDVAMSGVAFTRDLDSGGRYTVINYDDTTGRTDTVTAGEGSSQRTAYFRHGLDGIRTFEGDSSLASVRAAVEELRNLLNDPPLDVEFVVDNDGTVTILQVRPLAVHTGADRYDTRDVTDELESVAETIKGLQRSRPLVLGEGTVLGVMPDWNPAEMIGTEPDLLATSLYEYLITDDVWARARAESGYRDVRPEPLMVTLAGRPYIDTLVDFNSFLPATLPDDLGCRLVEHYVDRLSAEPDLQDKVEFDVAFTCLDFAFDERREQLEDAGFTDEEIATLRRHLRELTDDIVTGDVAPIATQCDRLVRLADRRQQLLDDEWETWSDTIRCVTHLLDDAREFGTLPFSILARYAFIGTVFLRSLGERGVLTDEEIETISEGVPTIAQELATDMQLLREGELDESDFLTQYGHLRPGTYDICSPRYDEDPSGYFDVDGGLDADPLALERDRESELTEWSPTLSPEAEAVFEDSRDRIRALIRDEGFTFTVDELISFITESIPLRELAKFEFTKNLSAALTLLRRGGREYHDLEPDELAALTFEEICQSATTNPSPVLSREFDRTINYRSKRAQIQDRITLPPVIRDSSEVRAFEVKSEQPNYITNETARAPVVQVEVREDLSPDELNGRIAMIPSADPGYDWIFGSDIAGLITKYGGVASHMAIRAAEFGLPAAIGCGEVVYEDITGAEVVELNCADGTFEKIN